jgi:hypothetical protein
LPCFKVFNFAPDLVPKDSLSQLRDMEAKQEKLKEDVEKEAKKQKKDSSKPAEPTPGVMRTSVLEIKGNLRFPTQSYKNLY